MDKKRTKELDFSKIERVYRGWLNASGPFQVPKMSDGLPPWGSKSALNRIGEGLRNGDSMAHDDARCLDQWRAAHSHVMNGFQAMLRARTANARRNGVNIAVAQRHKRRSTIINKLARERGMQLARMDDVAGIRLIFETIEELYNFRSSFLASRHKHTRRSEKDKYDYIANPKDTGYRGIHDIYVYHSDSPDHAVANGLMIEVQYRTYVQHAWSTANEIVTMTTDHRTKFNQGDPKYLEFFKLASEVIARVWENRKGVYPDISNVDLADKFDEIEIEIRILRLLNSLSISSEHMMMNVGGAVIMRFKQDGSLELIRIPQFSRSLEHYFDMEKKFPGDDIVLVKAVTFDEMRSAYRNYFSDAKQFVQLMGAGLDKLRGIAQT